jgi:hypothetical protein
VIVKLSTSETILSLPEFIETTIYCASGALMEKLANAPSTAVSNVISDDCVIWWMGTRSFTTSGQHKPFSEHEPLAEDINPAQTGHNRLLFYLH